ncbi:hypothetical protein UFOVP1082_49 [uncultured Caudovirales phage]|uniref:Uncharacterized protein n=1 Tax=uncultured Caudovirales phage TaxID=2100421 RepID=A0A6J5SG57_9CAUD|nr:hypothetical protein UFOVP906_27 [uncultured Caudovirales phage]CAB4176692.1 hypothetical protein UFOVP992_53 [uncultured Caudovirales phage]CAB4183446.1 hypothetical protein UFOVP1082_49 [uncultured Caudovirales phage]CAB4197655.1 hypothetical protein UFOVP1322_34 [uncultured Caudovirales phage]CAB4212983.1 hypothetical protein UFOVP1434_56 [uncultured Caudovirales phage]
MRINIIEKIGGTTLKTTAVNSGVIADACWSVLYNKAETVISSVTAASSGNGFYFALHALPNSRVWLVNEWCQRVGVNTYAERQFVKVILPDAG